MLKPETDTQSETSMLHALIMAGGSGTRFWPASRASKPKQLLDLVGGKTMIQATLERLDGLVSDADVLVMTNQSLVDAIVAQLPSVPPQGIIGEPHKRDTAPCVGVAAALLGHRDSEATMIVMPADHVISPTEAFHHAVKHAVQIVERDPDCLVTFGIPPSYPAQTFGYIERGEPLGIGAGETRAFAVHQFREKPSLETAEQYLAAGNFMWNSGIFVWKAKTILAALQRFEPELFEHVQRVEHAIGTSGFDTALEAAFDAIKGISIDYAVMERYEKVAVIEAPFSWDDVGSWGSLARMACTDDHGNAVMGKHLGIDTTGTIIRSNDHHLVVTLGVRDLVVVHTDDATLIARKDDEESIREVVKLLREKGWDEYL